MKLDRTWCTKLTATLHEKKRYILHYRNLKTYLRLGMKLKKIHKMVRFSQTAWLKTYIEFNSQKRRDQLGVPEIVLETFEQCRFRKKFRKYTFAPEL